MRVLVADDHTLVRTGMRLLLESMPGITVVGEAADGREALCLIEQLRPDVVIMDLAMPDVSGLDALRQAGERFPGTRIVVVSMHADEAYVQQALASGAAGYLLKGADKAELEHALRVVAQGQTYLSPAVSQAVVAALMKASDSVRVTSQLESLTPRQREVLKLIAEGYSTKRAAAELGVSVKTVEAHRGAIMQRLGVRDLAGLVRFAVRVGLVASS